jgi:hypothetical protein
MVRTQIQFTEAEIEALRREASQRHLSLSAVVREAVDRSLASRHRGPSVQERRDRASAACGRFHSGRGDVSARHDDYFVDSIDE